jgi:DNA primase
MDFAGRTTQEMTVSRGSSLDAKELIKQAIDIVDLVGSSIQLRRQGRNFVGLCPWHDDTRPSFQVNPERQSFKCWVCDIGGDIFSFVMKMEGVTFPEALKMLADRAGIQLEPPRGRPQGEIGGPDDKRTLYQAMAWAEKQYHDCLLRSPEAEPARGYLQKRGISAESIAKFHLGFCPNQPAWILSRSERSGFGPKILEAIGLLARSAGGGNLYDRFRGRVLFAIRDTQGRPVGLGGRLMPESGMTSPAKYVNSPETPLFTKSNLLYGLDVARETMRHSRTALVMEGYTDCIMAQQHGFGDAVAVLGTALGEQHIRTLKRFADRIVLVLDGDEAGQRRTNEVLELFVSQQVDLRVVTLPEELDPAEFLEEHGAEAFRDLLATRAVDALEHAFWARTRGVDLVGDIHGSSRALEEIVSVVAKAPRLGAGTTREDRIREEKILERLAFKFRVPEQAVRERLATLRRSGRGKATSRRPISAGAAGGAEPSAPSSGGQIDPWQRELMEIVIQFPEHLPAVRGEIRPEDVQFRPCRQIYETCLRLLDGGVAPTFERLMLEFDEPGLKSLLVELDEHGRAKGITDPAALIEELKRYFRQVQAAKQRVVDAAELSEGRLPHSEEVALLNQILQKECTRHGRTKPTDG